MTNTWRAIHFIKAGLTVFVFRHHPQSLLVLLLCQISSLTVIIVTVCPTHSSIDNLIVLLETLEVRILAELAGEILSVVGIFGRDIACADRTS